MLEEITPQQFTMWRAYSILEPFADQRSDLQAALICKTLWDIHRDPKSKKPITIEDFRLQYGGKFGLPKVAPAPKRTQSLAEKRANLELWAMAYAAK